jgi:hypothetical protein
LLLSAPRLDIVIIIIVVKVGPAGDFYTIWNMKYGQPERELIFSAGPMKWDLCDNLIFGCGEWAPRIYITLVPFPCHIQLAFIIFIQPPSIFYSHRNNNGTKAHTLGLQFIF